MSVLCELDLNAGNWGFFLEPESPSFGVEIGFKENGGPVKKFDSLSFGFSVFLEEELFFEATYPPKGVEYVATDQIYATNDNIDFLAEGQVRLFVWAENGGTRFEGETFFDVPKPPKPCQEWVWDNGVWVPPFPPPDDGQKYYWDCDKKDWATIDLSSEQGDE